MVITRFMIRSDYLAVVSIENASFTNPWTEADFRRCINNYYCVGLTATIGNDVVGYLIYEFRKTSFRLLNLAVHPDWRRSGVGAALVERLISKLHALNRTRIVLDVRETNLPAQLFFRRQGFLATGLERRAFRDTHEDAYRFEYVLPSVAEFDELVPFRGKA